MTRSIIIACLAVLHCRVATGEVVKQTHRSPDGRWTIQIERVSEAPDFTVTLKRGNQALWSYHPDPRDKSVRIFWRPDSSAFLMEHVNWQKVYRLYIISVAEPHLKMFPIAVEPNIYPAAIVDGTVAWDVREGLDLVIKFRIEDQESKKREMRITQWRELRSDKL